MTKSLLSAAETRKMKSAGASDAKSGLASVDLVLELAKEPSAELEAEMKTAYLLGHISETWAKAQLKAKTNVKITPSVKEKAAGAIMAKKGKRTKVSARTPASDIRTADEHRYFEAGTTAWSRVRKDADLPILSGENKGKRPSEVEPKPRAPKAPATPAVDVTVEGKEAGAAIPVFPPAVNDADIQRHTTQIAGAADAYVKRNAKAFASTPAKALKAIYIAFIEAATAEVAKMEEAAKEAAAAKEAKIRGK